jgi:hypothetical protein
MSGSSGTWYGTFSKRGNMIIRRPKGWDMVEKERGYGTWCQA